MARRYGRNQRRRHREEIAQLQQDRAQLLAVADRREANIRELERRIRRWAHRIVTILGEHHPFNEEAKKLRVNGGFESGRFRIRKPAILSLREAAVIASVADYDAAAEIIDVILHRVEVERDVHGVPRAIVKLISGKSEKVYYAIDDDFLIEGRRDPQFIEWLAEELARELGRSRAEAA